MRTLAEVFDSLSQAVWEPTQGNLVGPCLVILRLLYYIMRFTQAHQAKIAATYLRLLLGQGIGRIRSEI